MRLVERSSIGGSRQGRRACTGAWAGWERFLLPRGVSSHQPQGERPVNIEETSATVIDTAFHIHCGLGPGLLESVYEEVLARLLRRRGLAVERQVMVKFEYDGLIFHEGLRIDLLVAGCLVVELKSIEHLAPVHAKILLEVPASHEPAVGAVNQLWRRDLQGGRQAGR